jgi:hypothetical protein
VEASAEVGVSVAALAVYGRGRVWHVASPAQADRIVAALVGGGEAPEPDSTFHRGGYAAVAEAEGAVEAAASGAEAGLRGEGELVVGRRNDRRTGETTFFLRLDARARGLLQALGRGPQAAASHAELAELRLARDGRPLELLVRGEVGAAGDVMPPPELLGRAGASAIGGAGRVERTVRLDLTDREVGRAFSAWWGDPLDGEALAALGAAAMDRAQHETRLYAVAREEDEAGASGALLVKVGGEWRRLTERDRLVGAWDRPPGGLWEPRLDCVPA